MTLHTLSALELGAAIAAGDVTPVEATDHYLERIGRLDSAVHAFTHVHAEAAQRRAAALHAAGRPAGAGPLWGVPVAVKDNEAEAGVTSSLGSAALSVTIPADGLVARLLDASGAVRLGRTAAPEMGLVCYTEPHGRPPTRNPWDLDRSTSGSSGGAAAAVAARLTPWAQGGDAGGSIRTPASTCGLVGHKPSRALVSNLSGAEALGLGCTGPLTRTVRDAAAALDVLAVRQPSDTDRPSGADFLTALDTPPPPLRVGWFLRPPGGFDVHPSCRDAVLRAAGLLEDLGHEVQEVACPWPDQIVDAFLTVWSVGAAASPVSPEAEHLLRPITRHMRQLGRAVDGPSALTALMLLRGLAQHGVAAGAGVDVLLTPTLARPPALVGELRDDDDPEAEGAALIAYTPFTPMANATGQPAVSLPVHHADGLPIGVQLIGRPAADLRVLQLAAQLEDVLAWQDRIPTLS